MERSRDWMDQAQGDLVGSPRERYTEQEAERLIRYAEQIIQFCESLLSQAEPS